MICPNIQIHMYMYINVQLNIHKLITYFIHRGSEVTINRNEITPSTHNICSHYWSARQLLTLEIWTYEYWTAEKMQVNKGPKKTENDRQKWKALATCSLTCVWHWRERENIGIEACVCSVSKWYLLWSIFCMHIDSYVYKEIIFCIKVSACTYMYKENWEC